MTAPCYVTNSSPLIVFQRIDRWSLLRELFGRLFIPPAVHLEVFGADLLPEWLAERPLAQPLASQIVAARLGAGEREAIALALELGATQVFLDDLAARRLAQSLNIAVLGSAGIVLRAKVQGLIPAVRPLLEAMQAAEFRVAPHVLDRILAAAGEA